MDRPVQIWLALFALIGACAAVAAEENTPPRRTRVVSPRVAEMLTAAVPKYEPPPVADPLAVADSDAATSPSEKPANAIVRLPKYLVREPKVPGPEEVMTKSARETFAMQKYLGDENGLERVLNMFSVAGLWEKIPVLGKYPFIVGQFQSRHSGLPEGPRTNEQRALDMYEKEKIAERWAQLSGLMSPELKPETPPPTAPKE